jgi:glycosyltransferase involved in cell wall biosynthesis
MSLRILLLSNAGWCPSGYGIQAQSFIPRLRAAGHELAVSAFFGLQGGQLEWEGIKHYPSGFQQFGNDVVHLHAADFNADIVIALIDVWVLRPDLHKLVRLVHWAPIDHSPVPKAVADRMRNAYAVMAYSKFAVNELEKVGINSYYIPLAVDTQVFRPISNRRAEIRARFGIPDGSFVVGMVAQNQSASFPTRKGFERIIPAMAELRRKGYRDLLLYIHTWPGTELGGVQLIDMIRAFGAEDWVFLPRPDTFPMGGLTRPQLAELYNAFDLYACPSMAEGFGIPLVEAAACGIPAIATNFSSMPELVPSGWLIQPVTRILTPLLSYQALASEDSIAELISYAYGHPAELAQESKKAIEFAQGYDWDHIIQEYWLPTLALIEKRISGEMLNKQNASLSSATGIVEKVDDITRMVGSDLPPGGIPDITQTGTPWP